MKSMVKALLASAAVIGSMTLAIPALAHSKMSESIPANMTSVGEDLDVLVLKFDRNVRLTVVELIFEDQEIEVDLPQGFVTEAEISFEPLGVGCYDWSWIAIAQDGHTMEGAGHFEIATNPKEHTCEFEGMEMDMEASEG